MSVDRSGKGGGAPMLSPKGLDAFLADTGLLEFTAYIMYRAEMNKLGGIALRWLSLDMATRRHWMDQALAHYLRWAADELQRRAARGN